MKNAQMKSKHMFIAFTPHMYIIYFCDVRSITIKSAHEEDTNL